MDFEVIDKTYGDAIAKGDIINEDGNFIIIESVEDNDLDAVEAYGQNLSTGDEWDNLLDPSASYDLYRSF